jgi:hypothetical protein
MPAATITRAAVERALIEDLLIESGEQLGPALWAPLDGPQTDAYESPADITGYGGAAGGGKSMLEIGLAVTRHRRSIVFRREADQVRDLWQKLSDVCGLYGRSNENLLVWRDLPGDRYVRLAGCKNPNDWKKYQGQGHDLFAFDEATEFLEYQIRTLIAWCRTTIPRQRCRVVLSFNPPTTPEGEWVIEFFSPWLNDKHPNPAEPGELRWYARIDDQDVEVPDGTLIERFNEAKGEVEAIQPLSRTFFPARLADNPLLEATGYRAQLQGLPEPLRSQMLYGDFTVGLDDDPWQVIPTSWVRAAQARWTATGRGTTSLTQVGIDVAQGGTDKTVFARRYGRWFAELESIPGPEVPDANVNAQHVARVLAEGGEGLIDADGIGASTYFLARARLGSAVRIYKGSAPTTQRDQSRALRFLNVRAAAYWRLREALDPSAPDPIALPPSRELRVELCATRYVAEDRTVKLEKKEKIRERLGRSPDLADAVVMAYWEPGRLGQAMADAMAPVIETDADPNVALAEAYDASAELEQLSRPAPSRERRALNWGDDQQRGWSV